jgi:hypothetical protein
MNMPSLRLLAAAIVFLAATSARAEPALTYQIAVEAGPHERQNTPVRALVLVPADWADKAEATLTGADGQKLPAQLAPAALLDAADAEPKGMVRRALWFLVPKLAAKETVTFQATIAPATAAADGFTWQDTAGKHVDLLLGKRPVLRYMYQAYENEPAKRDLNNKPFHHLFDPATGARLVTKGSGGHETHHQGLFYGFTKVTFGGGVCNTWWCHDGEHELHKKFLAQLAGPVLARQRVAVDWNDRQGKTFCTEERELTAYAASGGTLVEWSSRLKSVRGSVTLDGDPHHSGFQFRADDEVAKRTKDTYFLRVEGKGKLGEERNDKTMVNLPWDAMSFALGDQRYTAVYIDSPRNPRPALYSERLYGRFGSTPGKQTLKEGEAPLELTYRIWLQQGEMTGDTATRLSADFAEPPKTTVTRK